MSVVVIFSLGPRAGVVALTRVSGHRRPDFSGPKSAMKRHGPLIIASMGERQPALRDGLVFIFTPCLRRARSICSRIPEH
jgi:hypothetical protein